MSCGIDCNLRTKTYDIAKPLVSLVKEVFTEHGHGDLTLQGFPDGKEELSLDDGPVVGILDDGMWRLRIKDDKNVSLYPPVLHDENVITLCCCGLEMLIQVTDEAARLYGLIEVPPSESGETVVIPPGSGRIRL